MNPRAPSARAWLDDHEGHIRGLAAPEAVSLVELAGLEARVLPHGPNWMIQDLRDARVNLWLSEAGTVCRVTAG